MIPKALPMSVLASFGEPKRLGTITVPADHRHETCLDVFRQRCSVNVHCDMNRDITYANYPRPSHILRPREKLDVYLFPKVLRGYVSSLDFLMFLRTFNFVHPGAQGAVLALEQLFHRLPRGYWLDSLDEPDCLWNDGIGPRPASIQVSRNAFNSKVFPTCLNIESEIERNCLVFCEVA